jgi:hypothetical protein
VRLDLPGLQLHQRASRYASAVHTADRSLAYSRFRPATTSVAQLVSKHFSYYAPTHVIVFEH